MNTTESTVSYGVYINKPTTLHTKCYRSYEEIKEFLPHFGEKEFDALNREGLWLNTISENERYCELIVVIDRKWINSENAFISTIFGRCTLDLLVQVVKGRNVKYGVF